MTRSIMFYALAAFFTIISAHAQELNCKISIEHRRVQGTNTQVFQTLENALNEFMNGRQWTNLQYQEKERIECTMLINVSEVVNNTGFQTTLTVQARRPVYNSSQNTTLLNYIDKDFSFSYTEYETLEFNENTFTSNLTSVLAYWAYVIIGLDNDSFAEMGGTPIFQMAERVVTNAQGKDQMGWEPNQSSGKRNRYWFTEQILHPDFEGLRKFDYIYHRQALDNMASKPGAARNVITENLDLLKTVHDRRPASMAMSLFFDAKVDELVNMYKPTGFEEKQKVYEILLLVNPAHLRQWQEIRDAR